MQKTHRIAKQEQKKTEINKDRSFVDSVMLIKLVFRVILFSLEFYFLYWKQMALSSFSGRDSYITMYFLACMAMKMARIFILFV